MRFALLFAVCLGLAASARVQKRSIGPLATIGSSIGSIGSSIGNIFSGPTPSPLNKYPLWKVHKYTGIDLKPVNPAEGEEMGAVPEENSGFMSPREGDGLPPKTIPLPDVEAFQPSAPYEVSLEADHEGINNLIPGGGSDGSKLSLLSSLLGRSDVAEDKIGLNPLKKKKLVPLGLGALSALVKNGYIGGGVGGFQSLLSGFGGSSASTAGFEGGSTVYRGVPSAPSGGFLSNLPFFGNRPRGTPLVLPDPILPDLPPLRIVPEAPKLPQLTLPGPYKLPYSTGSYVSIKAPKPQPMSSEPEYSPPATSYGVPDLSTTHDYESALSPSVQQYPTSPMYQAPAPEMFNPSGPQYIPSSAPQYSAPPATQYSAPPAPQYSAPPAPQYSSPSASHYNAPPALQYSAPPASQYADPSPTYYPQNYRTSYDVAASEPEISVTVPQHQQVRSMKQQEVSFSPNSDAPSTLESNSTAERNSSESS